MASSRVLGARLENLWQQAREPTFVLSPECKLVLVNRAWEELTGYPSDQVLGQVCKAHGPSAKPGDAAGLAASFYPPAEALAGQPTGGPTLIVHASGERRWRRVEFWPFHDDRGALLMLLGLVRPPESAPMVPDAESQRLRHELLDVRNRMLTRHGFDDLVGAGPLHRRLLEQVRAAAASTVPVLIVGEAGTGKRLVAQAIHQMGSAPHGPLVPFDCEAMPAPALEKELVDQLACTNGRCLSGRDGATLLLAQVFHLPRDLQLRLAAALEAPMRLLATATSEPDDALRSERLHPDLYYALTALVIRVPALRQRVDEIPLFAQHFLELANQHGTRQFQGFAPDALAILAGYDWPGNLRELARVVADSYARGQGDLIDVEDLPSAIRGHYGAAYNPPSVPAALTPLDDLLTQVERRLIEYALQRARHNKSKAADLLSISRPRLYRRIKELGLPDEPEALDEPAAANGSRA